MEIWHGNATAKRFSPPPQSRVQPSPATLQLHQRDNQPPATRKMADKCLDKYMPGGSHRARSSFKYLLLDKFHVTYYHKAQTPRRLRNIDRRNAGILSSPPDRLDRLRRNPRAIARHAPHILFSSDRDRLPCPRIASTPATSDTLLFRRRG